MLHVVCLRGLLASHSQGDRTDQQVCVVKYVHLRPLDQQEESELNEQHERQLPDAADVQEHGAGQQGEQHAVAEVLQRTRDSEGGRLTSQMYSLYSEVRQRRRIWEGSVGLTSGKWQGKLWLEHTVKPSFAVVVRLCRRHSVTGVFSWLNTQSCSFSLLQVN